MRYYDSAEAMAAAGVAPHPQYPEVWVSVPEIVTQPAWTLPGDTATLSLFELQERRLDVLRRLWNATQPREGGKTGGEGTGWAIWSRPVGTTSTRSTATSR